LGTQHNALDSESGTSEPKGHLGVWCGAVVDQPQHVSRRTIEVWYSQTNQLSTALFE
jgi:hypothetical protein